MADVHSNFRALVDIVTTLRNPGGCDWDRVQTESSMRPYVLEEAYEVVDAIDRGDDHELKKELGDLLFTVALICRIAEERGAFGLSDAIARVNEKMISRHPHVFVEGFDRSELESWEARKARERAAEDGPTSALDGVPTALPALLRAHRVSEKASRVGFDWPDVKGVREKLDEEIGELDEAIASGDPEAITEELGDVLFTTVNLGRHLPVGAEEALRIATNRFAERFQRLEQDLSDQGLRVHDTDAETLEARWRALKASPKKETTTP